MQHRAQKLTTKFKLRLSFRLAEKNIDLKFWPQNHYELAATKICAPTLA